MALKNLKQGLSHLPTWKSQMCSSMLQLHSSPTGHNFWNLLNATVSNEPTARNRQRKPNAAPVPQRTHAPIKRAVTQPIRLIFENNGERRKSVNLGSRDKSSLGEFWRRTTCPSAKEASPHEYGPGAQRDEPTNRSLRIVGAGVEPIASRGPRRAYSSFAATQRRLAGKTVRSMSSSAVLLFGDRWERRPKELEKRKKRMSKEIKQIEECLSIKHKNEAEKSGIGGKKGGKKKSSADKNE